MESLLMTRPITHSSEILIQDFDPSIEQRAYREESFFLSIDEVLGRPAWEESEELVGCRIPPVAHLFGKPGFLFSNFFDHVAPSLPAYCSKSEHATGPAGAADTEGVALRIRQQKDERDEPETDEKS